MIQKELGIGIDLVIQKELGKQINNVVHMVLNLYTKNCKLDAQILADLCFASLQVAKRE